MHVYVKDCPRACDCGIMYAIYIGKQFFQYKFKHQMTLLTQADHTSLNCMLIKHYSGQPSTYLVDNVRASKAKDVVRQQRSEEEANGLGDQTMEKRILLAKCRFVRICMFTSMYLNVRA